MSGDLIMSSFTFQISATETSLTGMRLCSSLLTFPNIPFLSQDKGGPHGFALSLLAFTFEEIQAVGPGIQNDMTVGFHSVQCLL